MKKIFRIIVFAFGLPLLAGIFSSCATKGFISNVTRADIRQLSQFEMLANVGEIEKGNKIIHNDSLTQVAQTLFATALAQEKALPITETIVIKDSTVYNKVQYEIYVLKNCLERNVRPKDLPVPPTIDSILCARNERFGMLVYDWGFVRSTSNYAGQVAKGIAIGILTMGTFYTVPYKDMTRSGILIYDTMNHNFAYVAAAARESSPLEEKTYQRQMKDLMKIYKR